MERSIGAFLVFAVFTCMTLTISKWSEARGVHDDICYLRQAHLFQRFGTAGLDTDIKRDDDGYLTAKLAEIGVRLPDAMSAPCHNLMPDTGRSVIQYPPGVGFLLALFPAGHQAVGLYGSTCFALLLIALAAIYFATNVFSIASATAAGTLSLYLMNNPMKSSYSLAPTVVVCAAVGFLTALLFRSASLRGELTVSTAMGFMLGVAIDFRIANVLLAIPYFVLFGMTLLVNRTPTRLLRAAGFGLSFVMGVMPALVANAINAGSPFKTTYAPHDASPPDFGLFPIMKQITNYSTGTQGFLLLLSLLGVFAILQMRDAKPQGLFIALGLAVNVVYFLTHPIFTPYYLVPSAVLSLWTVFFVVYLHPAVGKRPYPVPIDQSVVRSSAESANPSGWSAGAPRL